MTTDDMIGMCNKCHDEFKYTGKILTKNDEEYQLIPSKIEKVNG